TEIMPQIHSSSFVDESATIIGDVRVGKDVYIAPSVSLRADEASPIIIGDECNIQDCAVFHGLKGSSIELGDNVSIAHGAVIHGPIRMGDECFVGFNSVVHASTLGKKCFVGHLAAVIGVTLKDGSFVPHGKVIDTQEKADALGRVPESLKDFNEEVVEVNCEFAKSYSIRRRSCLGQ
ncbi:MAG: DapH/DapD/GlmU-related protein, partial [Methanothrix sp.]